MQEGVPGRTYLHCFFFHIKERTKSMKKSRKILIGILICVIIGSVFISDTIMLRRIKMRRFTRNFRKRL